MVWMKLVYHKRRRPLVTQKLVLVKPFTQAQQRIYILSSNLRTWTFFNAKTDLTNLGTKPLNNWKICYPKLLEEGNTRMNWLMLLIIVVIILHHLVLQLSWRYLITSAFASSADCEKPTLTTIKEQLCTQYHFQPAQCISIFEICNALKLIIVTPATNVVSECSASVLRRVKTYLCATMSRLWLNNVLILHAHKDRTDDLIIPSCLNEFVRGNEHRMSVFGDFATQLLASYSSIFLNAECIFNQTLSVM